MTSAIPESLRPAVARGLMAAFGTTELEAAAPLSGGLSGAGVFRIRVGGIAYALRLTLSRDALRDPARGFACMVTAAEACLAPTVRYACAEDGVAITDLVAQRPLAEYPGDGGPLVVELAQAIRLLHRTPAFPPLTDYMVGMRALIAEHLASGLLDPLATAELFERFDGLAGTYTTSPDDLVSSHNDINPGNVIYDGRRLWLIDWEAAFLADRYVDLATAANWLARTPAHEDLLLATYFNGPPTPRQRARFEVMKAVNHVFVGVIFLNTVSAEAPDIVLSDRTLAGPSLTEMRRGLASGVVSFARREDRVAYGKARLNQALESLRSEPFARALQAVARSD